MKTKYISRFYTKLIKTNTCWLWQGGMTDRGYGQYWDGAKMRRAHIFAYEVFIGPVPLGLEIDHICRIRHCVNPDHLEPVTHQENCRRGIGSKLRCKHGHEYTPENTALRGPQQRRVCRTCLNMRRREKYYTPHPRQPKTHCPQGHAYVGTNIYINSKGYRECLICNRAAKRKHAARKKMI